MSRFRFELAAPADDADLREVLRETPMQGRISVAFLREPSWFAASVIDGDVRQVIACRDCESGRVVGFGSRAIRTLYIDGQPQRVGYLNSLRLLSPYRNQGLVARGYAFFRKMHADGLAPYYLTTIAAGNVPALNSLTKGRAGLPMYVPAGDYHTFAIPLTRRPLKNRTSLKIRLASPDDLTAIFEFLNREGPRRQFFPVVSSEELSSGTGQFLGLQLEDILLAWRGAQLVGMLGAWDQHGYKQNVVMGYEGALRWMRPVLNAYWSLHGQPRLPPPGGPLHFRVAAFPIVVHDSADILEELLAATCCRHSHSVASHLLLGMHERDPLLPIARRWMTACYTTHLYLVAWNGLDEIADLAQRRVPYMELGAL